MLTQEQINMLDAHKQRSKYSPEEKAEKMRESKRKYEEARLGENFSIRLMPEVRIQVEEYVTPEKTRNRIIQEAIMEYFNNHPITK